MERNRKEIMANKNFNLVIAILIAISLWVYVISEVNPLTEQTMTKIPVQLLNAQTIYDRELALSGDQNYTIDVVLEGKRADVIKVTSDEIVANADLFGFGKGENYLTVTVSVPDGVIIKSLNPAKIKVIIEPRITANKNILITYSGGIVEGKEPGRVVINPAQLEVTGPESLVNAVDHITVTMNMGQLSTEKKSFELKTSPMDSSGNIIEHVNLSADIVQISAEMLEVKEVQLIPKYIGEINPNYDVNSLNSPSTIKIKGDAGALLGINSITTKDVDLSLLSPSEKLLVTPIYPEGIEPAKGSEQIFVEIKTKNIITTQLFYDTTEVEILNADSNLNTQIKNTSIVVSVTGKADLINLLQKQDIVPYVDLSGANAGESNYPILFRYTKGFDKVVGEPAIVNIGITNK